jgi:predicted NUDIX family NTP pyrophosphohydrolase
MFRRHGGEVQVLLVHPGGPLWAHKDAGAWTVPKGAPHAGEDGLEAARREFREETGFTAVGPFTALAPVRQKGGKIVEAWAFEGDCDPRQLVSAPFTMEWPPRSGKMREFPEVDRAELFDLATAKRKINAAQVPFLEELERLLSSQELA